MPCRPISLPHTNPIFRIFSTEGRKRTMLTAEMFAANLRVLIGKTADRATVTLNDFRDAMCNLSQGKSVTDCMLHAQFLMQVAWKKGSDQ